MSLFFNTPNMNLIVPTVGLQVGPDWANEINASLVILDSHNHSPGSGIQITPSGININADLGFSANNAVNLRSVRFVEQPSPISGAADLACLYFSGVDFYANDGAGNQIRITQSGSVAGSAGTITGLPSGTASASFQAGSGTFQFQQATATAANIDAGTLIVRYPGSYPAPSGNAIAIQAPTSLASSYSITLPALPAQTNVMTLASTGIISSLTYDQVGQAMSSVGANAIAASMNSTGANAIASTMTTTGTDAIATTMDSTGANTLAEKVTRAVGNNVGLLGVAYSQPSGAYTTSSNIYVNPTNLGVNITTSGRPIWIGVIPDPAGGAVANFQVQSTSSGAVTGQYEFTINGVRVSEQKFGLTTTLTNATFSGAINPTIFPAGAGTYLVKFNVECTGVSTLLLVSNFILVVYEL